MPSAPPHLDNDAIARLERATLDAVAPPTVLALPGWLLPLDHASIGRAKSAVPLRHSGLAPDDVPRIRDLYLARGFAPRWRVADVPGLTPIHRALEDHECSATQPTLVQTGTVVALAALTAPHNVHISTQPCHAWRAVYTAPGFDAQDGRDRVEALSRGQHTLYATVLAHGVPVAAGTASLSQGWASIHGMRTTLPARGQGRARAILGALGRAAQERGLTQVFLQVEEDNAPAQALYAHCGFRTVWRYRYWAPT